MVVLDGLQSCFRRRGRNFDIIGSGRSRVMLKSLKWPKFVQPSVVTVEYVSQLEWRNLYSYHTRHCQFVKSFWLDLDRRPSKVIKSIKSLSLGPYPNWLHTHAQAAQVPVATVTSTTARIIYSHYRPQYRRWLSRYRWDRSGIVGFVLFSLRQRHRPSLVFFIFGFLH